MCPAYSVGAGRNTRPGIRVGLTVKSVVYVERIQKHIFYYHINASIPLFKLFQIPYPPFVYSFN